MPMESKEIYPALFAVKDLIFLIQNKSENGINTN